MPLFLTSTAATDELQDETLPVQMVGVRVEALGKALSEILWRCATDGRAIVALPGQVIARDWCTERAALREQHGEAHSDESTVDRAVTDALFGLIGRWAQACKPSTPDRAAVAEGLSLYTFDSDTATDTFVCENVNKFMEDGGCGVMWFLCSCLLSHGLEKTRQGALLGSTRCGTDWWRTEMDTPDSPLIGKFGYCSQAAD